MNEPRENASTLPWRREEYLYVWGQALVYSLVKGNMLVHFPGGAEKYLDDIRAAGHPVVLPRSIRRMGRPSRRKMNGAEGADEPAAVT